MGSVSEIMSLLSVSNLNMEVRNVSGLHGTAASHRSTMKRWLQVCKDATKTVLSRAFRTQCRIPETSFVSTHNESNIIDILTKETNISENIHLDTNGREVDPIKMFASLDVDLLSSARQNTKAKCFKVYQGHVQEKIDFFENRLVGRNEGNCKNCEKERLVPLRNLKEKVKFFEGLTKENDLDVRKQKENFDNNVNEILVGVKGYSRNQTIKPVRNNFEDLSKQEKDKIILSLIKELHKQCHFMKHATSIIQACLKVKHFIYSSVHLEAEKLLLLAGLRRNMLLKKIRELEFEENEKHVKSNTIRAEISDLQFSTCKEHKNKKSSFIIVCSNKTDMHVSHMIKTKSEKGFISIPGVMAFENLQEDCSININVYQLHLGGTQHMLQFINEKNKIRRKSSIQYKDIHSQALVQDHVLEPLYKPYNSLEINFANRENVTINCSDGCSLQGLLTIELFEGKTTFQF